MPPTPQARSIPTWVVNAGSSSLKIRVDPAHRSYGIGRLGATTSEWTLDGVRTERSGVPDVRTAFELVLAHERRASDHVAPAVVGHRVVHGGDVFVAPVVLDERVVSRLREMHDLAPLHLPANLQGIDAAREAFPLATHVAVFDTAFHATLPRRASTYPLPHEVSETHGLRRFGFHGTSHDASSTKVAAALGKDRTDLKIVTLHLGNGASAAAVDRGESVDTTMGFTPLEGLMMGTRCGDVDPGILVHLLRRGIDVDRLEAMLQNESGLLGVSGRSADVRDVWEAHDAGDDRATAALDVYAHRLRKTIAAMAASMGGIDVLVFTGGLGEHDARMRRCATRGLEFLGIAIDDRLNDEHGPRLTAHGARVETWIVPSDEEGAIAEVAVRASLGTADGTTVEEERT